MPRDTFITIDLSDMRIVDIRRADAAGALDNLEMLLTSSRDP